MARYILVSFLSQNFAASFAAADWPQHVTILQTFETDAPTHEIQRIVSDACARQRPIGVVGQSREMFGPEESIPVTELALPAELATFREALRTAAQAVASFPERIYPTYRPHVTDCRGAEFAVGEQATLESVSIVERLPEGFRVVATSRLAGA